MARYHVNHRSIWVDFPCSDDDCSEQHVHVFTDDELNIHDATVAQYVLDRLGAVLGG